MYMPLQRFADPGGSRLRLVFQVIETVFLRTGTQRYTYFSYLGSAWMQGETIRSLLRSRLQRAGVSDDAVAVNKHIRELFREIEDDLRYKYVKYTSVYNEVLEAVLSTKKLLSEDEKLVPLHLFLEFGASSETLISLMSIGLSRTSAILLASAARLRSTLTVEECRNFLNRTNLDYAKLLAICIAEIRRIRIASVS